MAKEYADGFFEKHRGRPFIQTELGIPSQGMNGSVHFLIDTGADETTLSALDAIRLGIDYSKLVVASTAEGVGGTVRTFPLQARISFKGSSQYFGCDVQIDVSDRSASMTLPSLLGRDILDRVRLEYDAPLKLLRLELKNEDVRFS